MPGATIVCRLCSSLADGGDDGTGRPLFMAYGDGTVAE
jgi:hypothetical protein